ncbi:pseudouridine-5'-phosphate glycosidase [Rhodococcus sp. D-6]|uniref:Pseudouridine-5'-phosphate glycosidase n=1 Tax=Rhodococcus sp. D-6 TaxID=1387842 RepID=A0AAU7V0W4_9NOCA|nr:MULTISPECIES: pseudouridine-5'-phosphate glycosidase [Rhodococcus]AOD22491.1 pseudouridine-5-phosphate glycosidase [Rhodococcus sp. p52]APE08471.1 pseudouridine-5-phosphate glycosidase [Rhodococcus sp. 2G]MCW3471735.1 pseudouridine-5'-phosphate glycosidase [Rhodococcus pyridinivorans]UTM38622.1 pseudouridine-5'-phosphate glycosidase [Rhodococcus pyridinivorans]
MSETIRVADYVREAIAAGRPVVALESTIFTHGLTRPRNVEVALEAEKRLRDSGVLPATIGVVDGTPTVGLSEQQIRMLGAEDVPVVKLGIRDLPVAAAKGLHGGTTVSATALLAHRAGIDVFATGGLGGVHRGASSTFDESADLVALATLPILVVSGGVKSVLDIPATLERLETLGVVVVGYRTTRFPGFYVRDSGCDVDEVESAEQAAAVARARDGLGLRAAVLVGNPVAAEAQIDPELHDRVLAEAEHAAAEAGTRGKAITPFLLEHMHRATEGHSLETNVAVYRGNVAVAAEIAHALAS